MTRSRCKRLLAGSMQASQTNRNNGTTHLPELGTDLVAALASLDVDNLTHGCLCFRESRGLFLVVALSSWTFTRRRLWGRSAMGELKYSF